MFSHRSPLIAGMLVAAFALNGCVAAVIPVVAGGALAGANADRDRQEADEPDPRVEIERGAPDGTIIEESAFTPDKRIAAPGSPDTSAPISSEYAALIAYARDQAEQILRQTDEDAPQASTAVLTNPPALDGKRDDCGERTPTVLIDLDPGDGLFTPPNAPNAQPALAEGLANLRALGLEITWLSANSAADAGKVRRALHASGLDPDKSDNLLLMRYQADRKQTRRGELSETHCTVAIAGDTRSDFDELYDYLLKPEAAFALESIIGNGWFLIPPVLDQN